MDWFDDIQIEELNDFDFKESYQDDLFEEEDAKDFGKLINSNFDF